jgi:hypothetical protein
VAERKTKRVSVEEVPEAEKETVLIVQPIDFDAPGGWRARSKLFRAVRELTLLQRLSHQGQVDVDRLIAAVLSVEELIVPRLSTNDGTPVEEVLDRLSAREFDQLLGGLLASSQSVPPTSASD